MKPKLALWRVGFHRLWVGDFVSNAGTAMMTFAVPVIGVTMMHLTTAQISYVIAASVSAPLVVALSAGVIADRVRRSRLFHTCNAGRFVIMTTILLLLVGKRLTWQELAIGLFATASFTLVYESAMAAAIPVLVSGDALVKANAWVEGGLSVTESGGPALSGVLITLFSAPVVVAFDALSYLFSSAMLVRLHVNSDERGEESRDPQISVVAEHLRDIRLGFRLLWAQPVQRIVLLAVATYNFFASWILAILAVYALRTLHMSPAALGLAFLLPTVVGVMGSIIADRLAQRVGLGRALTSSFSLIAAGALVLPVTRVMGPAGAAAVMSAVLCVFEVCVVVNLIIGRTMRQALFPARHLSKITGTARFITWGVDPIGALLGGLVAATSLGVYGSLAAGCAGFPLAALLCLSSPDLRRFRQLPSVVDGGAPSLVHYEGDNAMPGDAWSIAEGIDV